MAYRIEPEPECRTFLDIQVKQDKMSLYTTILTSDLPHLHTNWYLLTPEQQAMHVEEYVDRFYPDFDDNPVVTWVERYV